MMRHRGTQINTLAPRKQFCATSLGVNQHALRNTCEMLSPVKLGSPLSPPPKTTSATPRGPPIGAPATLSRPNIRRDLSTDSAPLQSLATSLDAALPSAATDECS